MTPRAMRKRSAGTHAILCNITAAFNYSVLACVKLSAATVGAEAVPTRPTIPAAVPLALASDLQPLPA